MRILFLDSGNSWRGGQYQVLNLAMELLRRGQEVLLACQKRSPLHSRAKEKGLPVEAIRIRGDADVRAWFRAGSILRAFEPTILHAHAGHAHAVAVAATLFHDVKALVVTRRVAFPVRRDFASRVKYLRFVSAYVAISSRVAETLREAGVRPEKIRVIPSSVHIDEFASDESPEDVRGELALNEDDFVVLNVGSLTKEKGQEDILDVAKVVTSEIPRARFIVAGEGRLLPRLQRRARELGVSSVTRFLGFRQDIPRLMRASNVFLFPSRSEGLGTVVLEAMAAGLPVVAARAGGTEETVREGLTGFLVNPGDVSAMAASLRTLHLRPELSREMSAAARLAVRDFSFSQSCEKHLELYSELAG
ncbi:MAG: glycosyltransferase family 4 protein [Candidatus Eisenbacteria bacterium]